MSGLLTGLGSLLTGSAAPFSPTDIAGLKVWLKADALVLSDGDQITSWTDSSGNGNTCSNSAFGGVCPIYKTNIINSLPVARFNGSSQFLTGDTNIGVSQPDTLFFVAKKSNNAQGRLFDSTDRQLIDSVASTDLIHMYAGGATDNAGSHAFASGTFHVLSYIFDGASSLGWFDKAADITGLLVGTAGLNQYKLSDPATPLAGDIAEVLIYNSSLSTGNRTSVENWLGAKYGLF